MTGRDMTLTLPLEPGLTADGSMTIHAREVVLELPLICTIGPLVLRNCRSGYRIPSIVCQYRRDYISNIAYNLIPAAAIVPLSELGP